MYIPPKKRRHSQLNILKSLSDSVKGDDDNEQLFGNYIASELREIIDPMVERIVKNNITNLLFKAQLGEVTLTNFIRPYSSMSHFFYYSFSFPLGWVIGHLSKFINEKKCVTIF